MKELIIGGWIDEIKEGGKGKWMKELMDGRMTDRSMDGRMGRKKGGV